MDNVLALSAFFYGNNLKSDEYGNYRFKAFIEYSNNKKNVVEFSQVTIIMAGYNGGRISIEEIGDLSCEEFHLDFDERFQKYSYDENTKKLVVAGSSSKMDGEYSVKITVK